MDLHRFKVCPAAVWQILALALPRDSKYEHGKHQQNKQSGNGARPVAKVAVSGLNSVSKSPRAGLPLSNRPSPMARPSQLPGLTSTRPRSAGNHNRVDPRH